MAKKKKNDNLEKVSEFFKDVKEKRETVPGYDSFYKLVLWSIFILVILILIFVYGRTPVEIVPAGNKTTLPANAFSYKELLENRIKDDSKYIVNVNNNETKTRLEATIKEGKVGGYLETETSTDKIVIKENEIYKIKFDNEELIENFDLNIGVLNLITLIKTLENNKSLKTIDGNVINYQYDITINEINYTIDTKVEDKAISTIEVKNENSKYTIVFK